MLNRRRMGRRGAVALEAAIVFSVLIVLFIGAFDLVNALAAWRQTRAASIGIAMAATNLAVQPTALSSPYSGLNLLAASDAYASSSAIVAYLPDVRNDPSTQFTVTLSSIAFTPVASCSASTCVCVTTNGTTGALSSAIGTGTTNTSGSNPVVCYTANVAWSVAMGQGYQSTTPMGGTTTRPCGLLTAVANTAQSSTTTLPQGLYGPYALLVADVSYTFKPAFLAFLPNNVTYFETSYVPPRTGSATTPVVGTTLPYVQFSPSTDSHICSGYV